jgi:hypothetical protein
LWTSLISPLRRLPKWMAYFRAFVAPAFEHPLLTMQFGLEISDRLVHFAEMLLTGRH